MAYSSRGLIGVGGWLALLVVTLWISAAVTVVQAVAIVFRLSSAVRPGTAGSLGVYTALIGLMLLGRAGLLGFMAWRLDKRQQADTPPLVSKLLWVNALAPPIVDVLAASVLLGLTAQLAGYTFGTELFRPLVYAAVWTLYLRRSERVANTYTGLGAADRLATVFD